MLKIFRFILQIVLLALVLFFGYHFFTKKELRSCVSLPLASLSGKSMQFNVDEQQVENFMDNFGSGLKNVTQRGENLWQNLGAVNEEASRAGENKDLAEKIVDKSKYLYCKTVVDRVESEN